MVLRPLRSHLFTGPIYASDFYVPDLYGFKSSEQKEVLLKPGVNHNNPTGTSKAGNEPVAQTGFLPSPSDQNYQQKLLLNPESSLDGSKCLHQSTSPPGSSSSQCSSPPSSPTFTISSPPVTPLHIYSCLVLYLLLLSHLFQHFHSIGLTLCLAFSAQHG